MLRACGAALRMTESGLARGKEAAFCFDDGGRKKGLESAVWG